MRYEAMRSGTKQWKAIGGAGGRLMRKMKIYGLIWRIGLKNSKEMDKQIIKKYIIGWRVLHYITLALPRLIANR